MAGSFRLERARDAEGRFVADDQSTPENEAWVLATAEDNDTNGGVAV